MEALKELLKLKDARIEIWSNDSYGIGLNYASCEVKDGYFLISEYGKGKTVEEAAKDYLSKISGRTLVFNACSPSRREVTVLL